MFILFYKIKMSNFTNRKWLSEEDLEDIVKNSEDSYFSDDSNQSYDSDMSPENINRPTSSENEEHDCPDDEETERKIWTKTLPRYPFLRKLELNVKIQKFH